MLLKCCNMFATNSSKPKIPSIRENERSPFVETLLECIKWQKERIAFLEEEFHKPRHRNGENFGECAFQRPKD